MPIVLENNEPIVRVPPPPSQWLNPIGKPWYLELVLLQKHLKNKHKCNNGPPTLLVKTPKQKTKKPGKTTHKKNFFNKELQLISTNKNGIF